MTAATGRSNAAHRQVQVTARSPRREMCDVTTVGFVMIHTCVEILGWVVTRLVTALQIYFPVMTIGMMTRDAAHQQVEDSARSPRREMCNVTTVVFVMTHGIVETLGWVVTRLVTALQIYFPVMTTPTPHITRAAAHHKTQVTVR